RRHTRFSRDWSSDVCSSDLTAEGQEREQPGAQEEPRRGDRSRARGGARGGGAHAVRASLVAKSPCGRTSSTAVSSTSTASGAAEIGRASCRDGAETSEGAGA